MRQSLMTGAAATPFAHLLGLGRAAGGRRAEEDEKKKDDEAKRAEEDEKKKDDEAKKAEEDEKKKDDEAKRAEEDEKKKDEEAKKAAEDETCKEDEDDDEDIRAAAASGRRAERARCRAIFSSKAAGVRPDVAAQLAFTTSLSSAEAIGILNAASAGAAPQASRRNIDERMAAVHVPPVGSDGGAPPATGAKGLAASIVSAMHKAQGRN